MTAKNNARSHISGGGALHAFSIPRAIQEHGQLFEQAANEEANNDELPDFMREAYMFSLNETTKRERAPIILQQSMAERDQLKKQNLK